MLFPSIRESILQERLSEFGNTHTKRLRLSAWLSGQVLPNCGTFNNQGRNADNNCNKSNAATKIISHHTTIKINATRNISIRSTNISNNKDQTNSNKNGTTKPGSINRPTATVKRNTKDNRNDTKNKINIGIVSYSTNISNNKNQTNSNKNGTSEPGDGVNRRTATVKRNTEGNPNNTKNEINSGIVSYTTNTTFSFWRNECYTTTFYTFSISDTAANNVFSLWSS